MCLVHFLAHDYALLQERYLVSMVYYTDEIAGVLHDHFQGSGKPLFLLHGLNTDSNKYAKPAEFEVLTSRTYFLFTNNLFMPSA